MSESDSALLSCNLQIHSSSHTDKCKVRTDNYKEEGQGATRTQKGELSLDREVRSGKEVSLLCGGVRGHGEKCGKRQWPGEGPVWKGTGGHQDPGRGESLGGCGGRHVKGDEAEDKEELGHSACLLL